MAAASCSVPQMKSLAGVAAKISPFAFPFSHALPRPSDARNRAGARFRNGSQRLLHNVGQAAALVAWAGVGAAVHSAALQVCVKPCHLADQVARHLLVSGPRRQQMDGVADLGDFGEHHRRPRSNQQVGSVAHRGIRRDAGKRIASAALQAHHQVGCRPGYAPPQVQLLQPLLCQLHNRRHHIAEALVLLVLHAHDVWSGPENGQCAGWQQPRRLQLFAAQAHHHGRASQVRVQAQVVQRSDWDFSAGSVDGNAAAVVVGQRNHVVDVGIARQQFRLDAPDREIDCGGNALHGGGDAQNVLGSHRSVIVQKPFEGIALKRRHRRRRSGCQRQILERWNNGLAHPVLVHPTAPRNVAFRVSDNGAVAQNGRAVPDVRQRNLVRLGNIFNQRQP